MDPKKRILEQRAAEAQKAIGLFGEWLFNGDEALRKSLEEELVEDARDGATEEAIVVDGCEVEDGSARPPRR